MKKIEKNGGFFLIIVFLGAILGNIIGDVIGSNIESLQAIKEVYKIGMKTPIYLDLKVMDLTFGINFYFNIMSILGIILAIILYRKY